MTEWIIQKYVPVGKESNELRYNEFTSVTVEVSEELRQILQDAQWNFPAPFLKKQHDILTNSLY